MSSKAALAKLVEMVNRLRQDLYQFGEIAAAVKDRPELRYALVDMFVTLIKFWKEIVRMKRKTASGEQALLL